MSDANFLAETVFAGPNGMTAFDWGPAGRLYVLEKQGRVMLHEPDGRGGYDSPRVFADIRNQVYVPLESGLLGMVLDPDFGANRFMYLFYSTPSDQRLVRVRANAAFTQMESGSEVVLLSGLPRAEDFHNAGDIQFHPNDPDNIYITLGDDGANAQAQNLDAYNGKLLKVNKTNGRGLASNPFQDGNLGSVRSRLWAQGLRNPFRFTFHPSVPNADVIYISENGDSTDRLSHARIGSNGAWNVQGDSGGFLNPPDPGHTVMETDLASLIGIAIAEDGPFADPDNPGSPVLYLANWINPLPNGSISRWRLSGAQLDTTTPLARDQGQRFAVGMNGVHLAFGPDGALYGTSCQNDASTNGFFTIRRVRYVGSAPPMAAFTSSPSPIDGDVPLVVNFTDGSTPGDRPIVSRTWNFGDGGTSTQANPSYTYRTAGNFTVSLAVVDDAGLRDTASASVTVRQGVRVTLSGAVRDGRDRMGNALPVPVQLRLYRLDGTTPLAFPGGLGPAGNGVDVAAGAAVNATLQLPLTEDGVVLTAGEGSTFEPARLGFTVPSGASQHAETLSIYLSDTAVRGQVTDTQGAPARVDLGVARASASTPYNLPGGRDYLPSAGVPATGAAHRVVTDVRGYYYLPIVDGDGGATFFFDLAADTGTATYLPLALSEAVVAGALVERDITVGLRVVGASCDDLSGVPTPSNVDYPTQIQPLWFGRCATCHNPTSSNNAGLDLTSGSYAELVRVPSIQVPGLNLVEPGRPDLSYLFAKINCAMPQVGTRMRPGAAMSAAEQALIRAWIVEGAGPGGGAPDAGLSDASPADAAAPDAATPDAAAPDAAAPDAATPDAATSDAAESDAASAEDAATADAAPPADGSLADGGDAMNTADGGPADVSAPDAAALGPDGATTDAGDLPDAQPGSTDANGFTRTPRTTGGCGCNTTPTPVDSSRFWLACLLLVTLLRPGSIRRTSRKDT